MYVCGVMVVQKKVITQGNAREMVALVRHQDVLRKREIDELVAELKEIHSDKHSYSDRLWARMIINAYIPAKKLPLKYQ